MTARVAWILAGALAWILAGPLACDALDSTPFRRDEPIPLGALELTVTGMEAVPRTPHIPLSTLHARRGDRVVVVFVEWEGLEDLDERERFLFVEELLEHRLTLADAAGNEYRALSAMTGPTYASLDTRGTLGGTVPRNWVVVFHVLEDERDFALLVENPEPRGGQVAAARVDLGTLEVP